MSIGQKVDYTYKKKLPLKDNAFIFLIMKGQQNNEEPLPVLIIMVNYIFAVLTQIKPCLLISFSSFRAWMETDQSSFFHFITATCVFSSSVSKIGSINNSNLKPNQWSNLDRTIRFIAQSRSEFSSCTVRDSWLHSVYCLTVKLKKD